MVSILPEGLPRHLRGKLLSILVVTKGESREGEAAPFFPERFITMSQHPHWLLLQPCLSGKADTVSFRARWRLEFLHMVSFLEAEGGTADPHV